MEQTAAFANWLSDYSQGVPGTTSLAIFGSVSRMCEAPSDCDVVWIVAEYSSEHLRAETQRSIAIVSGAFCSRWQLRLSVHLFTQHEVLADLGLVATLLGGLCVPVVDSGMLAYVMTSSGPTKCRIKSSRFT